MKFSDMTFWQLPLDKLIQTFFVMILKNIFIFSKLAPTFRPPKIEVGEEL